MDGSLWNPLFAGNHTSLIYDSALYMLFSICCLIDKDTVRLLINKIINEKAAGPSGLKPRMVKSAGEVDNRPYKPDRGRIQHERA